MTYNSCKLIKLPINISFGSQSCAPFNYFKIRGTSHIGKKHKNQNLSCDEGQGQLSFKSAVQHTYIFFSQGVSYVPSCICKHIWIICNYFIAFILLCLVSFPHKHTLHTH